MRRSWSVLSSVMGCNSIVDIKMITVLLTIQSIVNTQKSEALMNLPAPATIADAIWRGDVERYNSLIQRSSRITIWYSQLNSREKNDCLVAWFKSVQTLNQELSKKYANSGIDFGREYEKRDEVDRGDYSKVDLLLMMEKRPTIFASSDWLRLMYNARRDSGLDIVAPVTKISQELSRESESFSGQGRNTGFYSFQYRLKDLEEKFRNWMKELM